MVNDSGSTRSLFHLEQMLALLSWLWDWKWIDLRWSGFESDIPIGKAYGALCQTKIWIDQPSGNDRTLTRIPSLQQRHLSSFPFRQVKRVRLFTGQISIGRIMVLPVLLNHFFSYCAMFGNAAHSIQISVHPFFIAAQVDTHRTTLLSRTESLSIFPTGIGRSGTFLLVDSILRMVREQLSLVWGDRISVVLSACSNEESRWNLLNRDSGTYSNSTSRADSDPWAVTVRDSYRKSEDPFRRRWFISDSPIWPLSRVWKNLTILNRAKVPSMRVFLMSQVTTKATSRRVQSWAKAWKIFRMPWRNEQSWQRILLRSQNYQ